MNNRSSCFPVEILPPIKHSTFCNYPSDVTSWINYPEVKPTQSGNSWEWVVNDVKGIRKEEEMPPIEGVAGQMVVSFFPAGGASINGFGSWLEMGRWYANLTNGRRDPSPGINQEVETLTAAAQTPLDKIEMLGQFVQRDVRYVAIELGIGG